MKKSIFLVLLIVILSTQSTTAVPVSGCGTYVQEVECSWFEFNGQKFKINLPDTLGFPSGTSDFYIEGDARYLCNETWCPFNVVENCLDVTYITASTDELCSSCCIGVRGNIDGGPDDGTLNGSIDIADLVYLISYMFIKGPAPPCFEEADINGDGSIDVADVLIIVFFMFRLGTPPGPCN